MASDIKERYEAIDGRLTVENDLATFDVGDSKCRQQWHNMTIHNDSVNEDEKQMWLWVGGMD